MHFLVSETFEDEYEDEDEDRGQLLEVFSSMEKADAYCQFNGIDIEIGSETGFSIEWRTVDPD
jgi:hypothetical protein